MENIINKNKELVENINKNESINNENFKDFNISNHKLKNKLANHGNNYIGTIIQLQDGRLASGGGDGSIIIYNKKSFKPEITIKEHSRHVYDLIQLKNGNLLSCSYADKTLNEYEIIDNNTYKLLSQVNVGNNNIPRQIIELEDFRIGLVAGNSNIFFSNLNNKLVEDFNIKCNENQLGLYLEMIMVKTGEFVIRGKKEKIQFFELNSRQLKEIININTNIDYYGCMLCMIDKRCLCLGGTDKITLIDVYNKNIIREIQDNISHICLLKLNENILLTGTNNGDLTQWKINDNNITFVIKKEKAHERNIYEIIKFNDLIISCSFDNSIRIW